MAHLENDPGPAFFFSYARARGKTPRSSRSADPDTSVHDFFDELTTQVRQLLPLPAGGEVGFMDTTLEAGAKWSSELLHNVATCRVFVALLSDPYLHRSEWCAMEWDMFTKRKAKAVCTGTLRKKAIVPVVWTPMLQTVPTTVGLVQRFRPTSLPADHLAMYDAEGLLGMSRLNSQYYRATVWAVARDIQIAWNCVETAPTPNATQNGLRRTFQVGKP